MSTLIFFHIKQEVMLHQAIFIATCLTILLQHKLTEKFPGLTSPEMSMSRNLVITTGIVRSRIKVLLSATITAKKTLQDMIISGGVTLSNVLCNLPQSFAWQVLEE